MYCTSDKVYVRNGTFTYSAMTPPMSDAMGSNQLTVLYTLQVRLLYLVRNNRSPSVVSKIVSQTLETSKLPYELRMRLVVLRKNVTLAIFTGRARVLCFSTYCTRVLGLY